MKFRLLLASLFSQIKGRHWWFAALLWIVLVAPAQATVILRVAIARGVNQVKVGSSTTGVVKDSAGRTVGTLPGMSAFSAQAISGNGVALNRWRSGFFWIEPQDKGFVYIGNRWYRGRVMVVPTDKGLTAINYIDLEEYLYSVLGSEVYSNWPLEALKAQAVAARTFAIHTRESQSNNIFDVGATPDSWQAYRGVETESQSFYKAVDETAGQVLTYNNKPILSVFHACSGGHTENVEDIWGSNQRYLRGVPDFDQGVGECEWQKAFSRAELGRLSGVGDVKELVPQRAAFGSVKSLRVVGNGGKSVVLTGDKLRNDLSLKSQRFTIEQTPVGFVFQGRGWGHGLGMSQWGARNLAQRGANYLQILGHYYRGASLSRLQVR
ncbi:MAG: SpoIID/LytB domain-containing protein [Nostocaceae cyanobacterium]|nr:SpoIID/LytB domain-containing protein [Nostocaceae cyanobacterium]